MKVDLLKLWAHGDVHGALNALENGKNMLIDINVVYCTYNNKRVSRGYARKFIEVSGYSCQRLMPTFIR